MQQVGLGRADRDRLEAEGDDRAIARAGAEHRMTAIARRGVCLVLSAPSGAGKTAIAHALLAGEPKLRRFRQRHHTAATQRRSRWRALPFRDQTEFDRMIAAGELLEWARVLGKHGYGTPRAPVEQALRDGRDLVFDIDWQGHAQLRAALPATWSAYLSCHRRSPHWTAG